MTERYPRPKVAIYHVWPEGEARFASCADVAWKIESGKSRNGPFEVGEDVEVIGDCGTFAAKFAGVFAKEGAECPIVRAEDPPLAYYVLGAWSDAGDENFPPAFAVRPAEQVLDDIQFQPFAAGFFPGALVATPMGERKVEDLAMGDLVLAWDADAVPETRAGRPAPDGKRPVRAKRIGRLTVSSRFRSVGRLMPVRFAPGALGCGMPHSDLTVTADHAMLVDGVLREAGALVDGTTVTRVPLSEFGGSCAVYQIETEARAIVLANGAPAETFVDNVPCRVFDGFVEFGTLRGGSPEMNEPPGRRASGAGPPAQIKIRLGIGAKEETAAWEPRADSGKSRRKELGEFN